MDRTAPIQGFSCIGISCVLLYREAMADSCAPGIKQICRCYSASVAACECSKPPSMRAVVARPLSCGLGGQQRRACNTEPPKWVLLRSMGLRSPSTAHASRSHQPLTRCRCFSDAVTARASRCEVKQRGSGAAINRCASGCICSDAAHRSPSTDDCCSQNTGCMHLSEGADDLRSVICGL